MKKSKRGMAMVTVIMIMVIIALITASVAMMFQNNLKQTQQQDENLKAYYLASSGIELGYTALMKDDYYKTATYPLNQVITLADGTATINVTKSGNWIVISSVGYVTVSSEENTTVMKFDLTNPEIVTREQ